MIKKGISFQPVTEHQDHKVVEVLDDSMKCEKCNGAINVAESNDGVIPCNACGHGNKTEEVGDSNE